ncbi:MAG: AI-2E family transporter [Telluria sp.]
MTSSVRSGPVVWAGIVAATCVLVALVGHMLWLAVPFIFAIVLYYVLLNPTQRLMRAGCGQDLSALLVGGGFFAVVALLVMLAFAWTDAPGEPWQDMLARYAQGGIRFVYHTMQVLEDRFPLARQMHLAKVVDTRFAAFTDTFVQKHLAGILVTAVAWLPSLLLAPFLTFFFLRDGARFKRFLARAVPNAFFEKTLFLLHEVDQTARRYFEGLFKLTLIDTAVLALGLWVIGVSSPLLLGLVSALLAWVPFVGSVAGCVLVVVVASTDAPSQPMVAYSAIGVFVLVRLLDDFVFMPLTLGRSLRVHPLVTVLMIFIGGALAGVPGLMLVLPLLGVVMVIGQTLGALATSPRLLARHRHARMLRARIASRGL